MKLIRTISAIGFLALVAVPISTTTASSASQSGAAYVVQGLPGTTVTLRIDTGPPRALQPKQVLGPLDLASGHHTFTFTGKNPGWTMKATVDVRPGSNSDVVLHRPASLSAQPVVTTYRNDLARIAAGKARVVVAHTAVVPPADVIVDGQVVFANIANGEFASADVPAGTHVVSLVPTGRKSPRLFGPVNLPIKAETLTRVFAIGRPSNNTMDVVVQQLSLHTTGSKVPTKVPLGSAGLVSHWRVHTTAPTSVSGEPGQTTKPWPSGWNTLAASALMLAVLAALGTGVRFGSVRRHSIGRASRTSRS